MVLASCTSSAGSGQAAQLGIPGAAKQPQCCIKSSCWVVLFCIFFLGGGGGVCVPTMEL